jgi:bifunctional non-homologous end joining protein LigD
VPRTALHAAPPRSPVVAAIRAQDLCHPIAHRLPFSGDGWLFELKHDGFRALARTGAVQALLSRTGRSMADAFPEIPRALAALRDNLVLDGELVVPDAYGRSDFEEVRRRNLLQRPRMIADAAAHRPAVLVVFDLLEVDGDDLRTLPLFERRRALHAHVAPMPGIQIIEHVETHGEALFRVIVDGDHEGIVAKRMDAPYRAGKYSSWVKIKNRAYSRRGAVEWQG